MKNIILVIAFAFSLAAFSQETTTIVLNETSQLQINGTTVNRETSFNQIKNLLGEPTLVKDYKNGKIKYQYPEQGLTLDIYNDKLSMIGANFNWDGDKNFPETSYNGQFMIGKIVVNKNTTENLMKRISFLRFEHLLSGLYAGNTENNSALVLVGFKENKITQIGFEFNVR